MLISFFIASTILGMFISCIWSTDGFLNVVFKMIYSGFTLWSVLMLAAAVWPSINNGTIRLF